MRLWKSWIVTQKDLSVFKKNKYVLYSLVAIPIIMGVVLPVIFIFTSKLSKLQSFHMLNFLLPLIKW